MRKAEHTSFFASESLARCRAERFARPIHGVTNFRRRSACGVTRGHDYRLAFVGVHESRCLQEPRFIAGRNGEEPMFIGMDQLPGHNAPPKNLDLSAPANRTRVGAASAQTPRQRLESGLSHFVDIADASVNDCADTANRTVKVACHLAPERAEQSRLVEVLHDD